MKGIRRIPGYFAAVALIVSVPVCIIKGISPVGALFRIITAVVSFYVLGFCISAVLLKDMDEKLGNEHTDALQQESDEDFQELEFPIVDSVDQDIPVRG